MTPRTIRRYSEAGRLPRVLLSQRCVRYRPADVAALVDPYNGEDPAGNRAFATGGHAHGHHRLDES